MVNHEMSINQAAQNIINYVEFLSLTTKEVQRDHVRLQLQIN